MAMGMAMAWLWRWLGLGDGGGDGNGWPGKEMAMAWRWHGGGMALAWHGEGKGKAGHGEAAMGEGPAWCEGTREQSVVQAVCLLKVVQKRWRRRRLSAEAEGLGGGGRCWQAWHTWSYQPSIVWLKSKRHRLR